MALLMTVVRIANEFVSWDKDSREMLTAGVRLEKRIL
jgi:hypothetical protein